MKLAVSVVAPDMAAEIDPRFGKARSFLIVDGKSGELLEVVDNSPGSPDHMETGFEVATFMVNKGVTAVLTGRVGFGLIPILRTAKVSLVTNVSGIAEEMVGRFIAGEDVSTPKLDVWPISKLSQRSPCSKKDASMLPTVTGCGAARCAARDKE